MYQDMLSAAKGIISDIRNAGFDCLIVGGAVRDMVCGRTPEDIDLVTTAHPDELEKIFPDIRWAGRAFGVSLLKRSDFTFELASARLERSYLDGRHPENITFSRSFKDDVMRRDFTVNAMLYDPFSGEITDYVNGISDAEKKIIRTVGDPEERFKEDALRMLRAVRFSSLRGFRLEEKSFAAIKKLSSNAAMLAGERVKNELDKILVSPGRKEALRIMHESGLLKVLIPEVDALCGVRQEKRFHPEGDVFTHTLLMLEHMQYPDITLAWSVILHDIGKPVTTFEDENKRIRAFGHEEKGAQMVNGIAARLKFSTAERESITSAVRNHMRMANVRDMRPAKLKRMMLDKNFPLELELHRLDCISSHRIMDCYLFLLDQLSEAEAKQLPLEPMVTGRDLISLGAVPSPEFKTILDELFDRQLTGEFDSRKSALEAAENLLISKSVKR